MKICKSNNKSWSFTGVYSPMVETERNLFLEKLGAIRGLWDDMWCVGGDFNVARFISERNRGGSIN